MITPNTSSPVSLHPWPHDCPVWRVLAPGDDMPHRRWADHQDVEMTGNPYRPPAYVCHPYHLDTDALQDLLALERAGFTVDATGPTITAGAACHREGYLMAWWHPGETLGARNQRHNRARALCATCPVLDACAELAAAQPHDVLEGVWAGRVYRGERPSRIGRAPLRKSPPPNRVRGRVSAASSSPRVVAANG